MDDNVIPLFKGLKKPANEEQLNTAIDLSIEYAEKILDLSLTDFGIVLQHPNGRLFSVGMVEVQKTDPDIPSA